MDCLARMRGRGCTTRVVLKDVLSSDCGCVCVCVCRVRLGVVCGCVGCEMVAHPAGLPLKRVCRWLAVALKGVAACVRVAARPAHSPLPSNMVTVYAMCRHTTLLQTLWPFTDTIWSQRAGDTTSSALRCAMLPM
jgi:hypothetical protein